MEYKFEYRNININILIFTVVSKELFLGRRYEIPKRIFFLDYQTDYFSHASSCIKPKLKTN
ncbi:hypothetical protein BpHYR1_031602 [Brachionus plicatilis]|uniref:Uncharacterized protein n=1 Tax=Brachionus plicatilis TaxID=10195 RepID=A0A3M7T0H0_BRAPC|nr:hypothetical protein BpHYR1_031602 [Brachionus plicatilis]